MTDDRRLQRLKKLVRVQRQVQALHETRHANHIASANRSEQEALDLIERFDAGTDMSALFPDLYHQRISRAYLTRDRNEVLAKEEATRVVAATLRADKVDRERRSIERILQEKGEQKDRLEIASRGTRGTK